MTTNPNPCAITELETARGQTDWPLKILDWATRKHAVTSSDYTGVTIESLRRVWALCDCWIALAEDDEETHREARRTVSGRLVGRDYTQHVVEAPQRDDVPAFDAVCDYFGVGAEIDQYGTVRIFIEIDEDEDRWSEFIDRSPYGRERRRMSAEFARRCSL